MYTALALIIAIIIILALVAVRTRNSALKFIFGLSWFLLLAWYTNNRPSTMAAGSAADTIAIVLIIGIALIICFWAFTANIKVTDTMTFKNGSVKNISREHTKWQLPKWIEGLAGTEDNSANEDFGTRFRKKYNRDDYRDRVHSALNQKRERR